MVEGQWKNLPDDILFDIMITRLPKEATRMCRCVCKPWRSFITKNLGVASNHGIVSDSGTKVYLSVTYSHLCLHGCDETLFVPKKLKFTKYLLSKGANSLVGYSNGLACILHEDLSRSPISYDVVLWNPFINRIKYVKKNHPGWGHVLGFGFVPHASDYKVVKLVSKRDKFPLKIEVYSLISNSWKSINTTNNYYVGRSHGSLQSSCTIVKGCAHWIAHRGKFWVPFILCFDLTTEVFREIDTPVVTGCKQVTAFRDSLALFSTRNGNEIMDVWVMKDYGIADTWSRLFTFYHSNFDSSILEILDSGKVIEIYGYIEPALFYPLLCP